MIHFLSKLNKLDRRWLYLLMFVLLIIWFIQPMKIPGGPPSLTTKRLYDAIEACPDDKVILVDSSWDAGSKSENLPQLESVIRHIVRAKKRFIVTSVGVTPLAPELATSTIRPVTEAAGYEYGRDWVQLGYIQAGPGGVGVIIDGLCRDFQRAYPTDIYGAKLEDLPLTKEVKSIQNVHLVYCVTYAPPMEWISFVKGQFGVPITYGCMTIMAPSYYPYFMSGQLEGMVIGLSGAAEYERMIEKEGAGSEMITPASFANVLIVLAVVLSNVGLWATKVEKRRQTRNG
jgi:hypothetical protein